MKGGWRIKPWQHFGGEKSSQIDEEKIQQHLPRVEAPWRGGTWALGEEWLGQEEEEEVTRFIGHGL
jgi:hypothetical protein